MLNKNEIYEAAIVDYTAEGQGVARVDGCAVFIPNAIVGERCRIRIEKAGKTWAAGKIVEILEKSPQRLNRACPVAKLCGGCDFWHMTYEEETRLKADRVRQALNRIGGESLETLPILAAPSCRGYRNKAQYPVSSKKGRAYAGFFRAGTHSIVENSRCLILPEETDRVKDAVIDYMNQFRVSAYEEASHTGLVRHIYVRRGTVSGQILVCLVVNGRRIPRPEELLTRLKKLPGFTTLVLSVNTRPGNAVLGDEFITLDGPGYIEDTLCGLTFRLSPRSFYQVNHDQAERLYTAAITQAGITKDDTVLDLYCGVGTITLAMASAAGKVIGVEVIPQAVEDARDNARRNGIENAEFFCGDAGQAALELEAKGVRADVAVVDPPRKGLNTDTIEALARMAPRRIVYVSCDPATLARDTALLKQRGYTVKNAMAADLFPRCAHVESIVCFTLSKERNTSMNNPKYQIDTAENKTFLAEIRNTLFDFGHRFPSPGGGSYYLGDDGTPWTERNRETWITCRMVHVYSLAHFLGHEGSAALADAGLKGLTGELRDQIHGGWYAGLTADGAVVPNKQCYAHAFVILAASSALLAGRPGAQELLTDALALYDRYFWNEEEGLSCDTWNTEFTVLDDYRGINANMHTVEAFLAAADATGNEMYRTRAGRIIAHVARWAKDNHYRIPEHFTSDWTPDLECNKDQPDDPFKPYGATPGHGLEWARLITQWATSAPISGEEKDSYIRVAEELFCRAVADGWNADGAPGIVYTTDWDGNPVVHDRMHWTLAEAINTSAVLYRVTGKAEYAARYAEFMQYLDETVLDHVNGSWFHQLDRNNRLMGTVWPGKSDLYHAVQATLIPYYPVNLSIAPAVKAGR